MKEIWDAYVALYTWQTGIPIAFYAAIAIAFIVYASSSQLKRSIMWGSIGLVLAYIFVLLLIASKLNINALWWSNENLRNKVTGLPALILAFIITVIISVKGSLDGAKSWRLGFVLFVLLGLLLLVIFTIGDIFFFGIHYILYILALIGFPTLSIIAAIFMFSKLDHPGTPLAVFCYLTISATTALMLFLSLITIHSQGLNTNALEIIEQFRSFSRNALSWLAPIISLSGPFVLMIIIFHFRQTIAIWVGCIFGLFTVTSIQLIMARSPLFDNIRNLFRTSDLTLTWILSIYTVSTVSLGAYYLWTLYQTRVDKKVKNLHPLLAIGAVVFNICFLYPVIISSEPWLWGAWFAGINLLIGLIILFGRLWVVSQKSDWDKYIMRSRIKKRKHKAGKKRKSFGS
jgi:hypothetical protein